MAKKIKKPDKIFSMKKWLMMFGGIAIFGIVILIVLQGGTKDEMQDSANALPSPENTLLPSQITVALYDPLEIASAHTKLFEKRLIDAGFQTIILRELVDPASSESDKTTVLFKTNTQKALEFFSKEVINSSVYRKGLNEAIAEDIVVSSWNIEDINWGKFTEEAEKLSRPEPKNVSVRVYHAGTVTNLIFLVENLLKEAGYSQTVVEKKENENTRPLVMYYRRNFKNIAKDMRELLSKNGFTEASYAFRLKQDADIFIELGENLTRTESAQTVPAPNIDVSLNKDVSIVILNGSGVSGVARQAAEKIQALGFKEVETENADRSDYKNITIQFREGLRNEADAVAKALEAEYGSATLEELSDVKVYITVIIGTR